jgi:integrase
MAKPRKRAGKWFCEVRKKGHPAQRKTFALYDDAKAWIRNTEKSLDEGARLSSRKQTLSWLLTEYREANTLDTYTTNVLQWWEERIGARKLSDLHRDDFIQGQRALAKLPNRTGGDLTPATVNRRVKMIASVLTWGMNAHSRIVGSNPARIPSLSEDNKRDPYKDGWTADKQEALVEACRTFASGKEGSTQPPMGEPALYLLVQLALCTGARAGELLAITWEDVDLDAYTIRITKNTKRNTTKTGSSRTVPVYGIAHDLLTALRKERPFDRGLILRNARTRKPYQYRMHWDAVRKKMDMLDFRFHDLRHVAASEMAMSGETLGTVSATLGHTNATTTQRYAHYADKAVTDLAKRMAERQRG